MRMFCTSARRRAVALVALVVAFVAFGVSAASAAPPPPPPPVGSHPPPITPNFALHPDYGPVGTQVTVQGICGKAPSEILYAVQVKSATGPQTIWLPPDFATPNPGPLGTFQFTFTFPAAGNFGTTDPLGPGTYFVGAACNGVPSGTIFLGQQPFTVTPSD